MSTCVVWCVPPLRSFAIILSMRSQKYTHIQILFRSWWHLRASAEITLNTMSQKGSLWSQFSSGKPPVIAGREEL